MKLRGRRAWDILCIHAQNVKMERIEGSDLYRVAIKIRPFWCRLVKIVSKRSIQDLANLRAKELEKLK